MAKMDKYRDEDPLRDETVEKYWNISLFGGVVILGAVAALLQILAATAQQILGGVAQIWTGGKMIANNTVHIPLLIRTNQVAGEILEAADGIAAATGRIQNAIIPASNNN